MALNHPDSDSSLILGVVSVSSSMPTGDPATLDEQLIPYAQFADQKPNNHIFHPEMKTKHDVIVEILKGHPLFTALTEVVPVPLLYVQQIWKHIQYVPEAGNHHFISNVDSLLYLE